MKLSRVLLVLTSALVGLFVMPLSNLFEVHVLPRSARPTWSMRPLIGLNLRLTRQGYLLS